MQRAAATTVRSTVRLASSKKPQWPVIYNHGHDSSSSSSSSSLAGSSVQTRCFARTASHGTPARPRPRQTAPIQHILVSKRNKEARKIVKARQDELKRKAVEISRIPRFDIDELRVEKSEGKRQEWLQILSTITDPIDRKVSRTIFQTLAVAYRRLKATEVELIVKLSIDDLPSETTADLFGPNIRRGILEIDDHGYIMFKSKYFKQMLVARRMQATGPENSYFLIEEEPAHYEMSRVLLSYMGTYGESGPLLTAREQRELDTAYPLLRYAALNWPDHCAACWSLGGRLTDLASKFWTTGKDSYFGAWLQAHHYYRPLRSGFMYSLPFRYFAWMDNPVSCLISWGLTEFAKSAIQCPYTPAEKSRALGTAIKAGHKEMISLLLSHGADFNGVGLVGGGNHLHDAVARKNPVPTLEYLLDQQPGFGFLVDEIDCEGRTPLHHAASQGKLDAVKVLLKHGAMVDVPSNMGLTALHHAAEKGFLDVVECLLKAGANPNGLSYLKTPMHLTYGSRDVEASKNALSGEVLQLLIKYGADPKAQDADGFTPLNTAVVRHNVKGVKALLPYYSEEDINIVGKRGSLREDSTALGLALVYGSSKEMVEDLIAKGAKGPPGGLIGHLVENCSLATPDTVRLICENFPEEVAAYEADTGKSVLEMMISAFPPPNRRIVNYLNPLTPNWQDTIMGNYEPYSGSGLEGIVKAGAIGDVISFARRNQNKGKFPWEEIWKTLSEPPVFPIWYLHGIKEFVQFRPEFNTSEHLIPALCHSFSWRDGRETVPLFYLDLIEKLPGTSLLDYADAETGATVLHQACESASTRIVDRLLNVHKANVNVQDASGATPLMRCFASSPLNTWKSGITQMLLEHGADPTIRDNKGRSAVTHMTMTDHWTTASVDRASLELLMQHPGTKGILDSPDSSGLRPIDYACQQNLYITVKELMDAGVELKTKDCNGVELLSRLSVQWSAYGRHAPLVEELLSMGADIYAMNENGGTFIQECLGFYGDIYYSRYLMADPRFDPMGPLPRLEGDKETPIELPFHYAIKNCHRKAIIILKSATPEQREKTVNGRSMDGTESTSLHLAIKAGSVGLVRSLIEAGADVNAVDAKGRTPLFFINRREPGLSMAEGAKMEAVTCGYWLLKAGADPNFRNRVTGKTVCESIKEYEGFDHKKPALRLLKDFGAEGEYEE
ncbi:transient receptor putative cation channel, subfamily A, member 1 [Orbilia javanica]|uniref:Transient receptor putative cation channel, subfamily A, member 1 n=1 Tax=Orbilia javanica TaxID=47235 RepID=A0AAN8NCT1_9PEZI